MTSVNTNQNPAFEQNYVPQGQPQTLTTNADTSAVVAGAGGGGATVVVPRDTLIQDVPPGLQNTTNSSATTVSLTPNEPLLVPGASTPLLDQGVAQQTSDFILSVGTSVLTLLGVTNTGQEISEPTVPQPLLPGQANSRGRTGAKGMGTSDNNTSGSTNGTAPPPVKETATTETPPKVVNTADTDGSGFTGGAAPLPLEVKPTPEIKPTTAGPKGVNTSDTAKLSAPIDGAVLTQDQYEMASDFYSTNPDNVYNALCNMSGVDPNEDSDTTQQLRQIAETIAQANQHGGLDGVDSTAPPDVQNALLGLYSGNNRDVVRALQGAAKNIVIINRAIEQDVNSTNSDIVFRALSAKVDISSMSPADQKGTLDALKLLSMALAFMSQIRARFAEMESNFSQLESNAKLAQMQGMTDDALLNYQMGLDNITANTAQMKDAYAQQALMKWLMPLITAIVAIISIAITIATAGIGSAVGIALIAATIALASFSIVDSCVGVLDKMCDAMGVTNEIARAAIKMAVMIVMVLLTGGAAAISSAGLMAGTIAANIAMGVTRAAIAEAVSIAINCVFSSGILTALFTALLKACGCDDDQAALGAMILTFIVMLAAIAGCIGIAGKGATTAAKAGLEEGGEAAGDSGSVALTEVDDATKGAGDVAQEGSSTAKSVAKEGGEAVAVGAGDIGSEVGTATESSLSQVIANMARRLKELIKDPIAYLKALQLLSACAEVAGSVMTARSDITQGKLAGIQADLEEQMAEINAILSYCNTLLPSFDVAVDKLNNDLKEFFKQVSDMMNFFTQFVQDLSAATTNLTTRG